MNVAITGASGYVGINLAHVLLEAGHTVTALDRVRSPALDDRVHWRNVDILDSQSVRSALQGAEVVYHLAAKITLKQDDPVAWQINTEGVRIVAEAALACGVRRMVHISSMASFDLAKCNGCLSEDSPRVSAADAPVYGRSKLAGEEQFLRIVERGLDGVICYPTALYGPLDNIDALSRINAVLLESARGNMPALIAGGFDLVDVRDIAIGIFQTGQKGRTGDRYFLGGHYAEMLDAFRLAANLVGRHGPRFVIPLGIIRAIAPLLTMISKEEEHPLSKTALDTIEFSPRVDRTKAGRDLGYAPRPLEETMRDLVAYYVQEGKFRTPA